MEMNGTFFTENVSMGGVVLSDILLVIFDSADIDDKMFGGLMGISCNGYANVVGTMFSEGLIKSHTYSIYLDDLGENYPPRYELLAIP